MENDVLISRAAAIDALTDTNIKRNVDSLCDGDMNRTIRAAQRAIAQLPAVDAAPVRHGHWIDCDGQYECSECHNISCCKGKYCTDCGSMMIEGEQNATDRR